MARSIRGVKKPKNYFSFFWLSVFIVLVFILQVSVSGFTDAFVLNGDALSGQYYRFLTAIFLHGGLSHLLFNLFALLLFGFILESVIGTRRFLGVFFVSGILANVFGVFFYPSSLGASGAIYGIIGCVTALRPGMMIWAFGVVMPMFVASIVWIIAGVIGLFVPSNTGHIAHLSGIFVGLLMGLFWINRFGRGYVKRRGAPLSEKSLRLWEDRFMR